MNSQYRLFKYCQSTGISTNIVLKREYAYNTFAINREVFKVRTELTGVRLYMPEKRGTVYGARACLRTIDSRSHLNAYAF